MTRIAVISDIHGNLPALQVMETGAPDARYAVLERTDHGWQAKLIAVPYDHHSAAEQARRHLRPSDPLNR